MIENYVGTRSATQVRSHAQKYDLKINKLRETSASKIIRSGGLASEEGQSERENRSYIVPESVKEETQIKEDTCPLQQRMDIPGLEECIAQLRSRVHEITQMKDVNRYSLALNYVSLSLNSLANEDPERKSK